MNAEISGLSATPPSSNQMSGDAQNIKLWQFSFNRLPILPEITTHGKGKELLDWLFDRKAVHAQQITEERRAEYVAVYAAEGGMHRGFEYYRAVGWERGGE